jgi:hypothetical protein
MALSGVIFSSPSLAQKVFGWDRWSPTAGRVKGPKVGHDHQVAPGVEDRLWTAGLMD